MVTLLAYTGNTEGTSGVGEEMTYSAWKALTLRWVWDIHVKTANGQTGLRIWETGQCGAKDPHHACG